MNPPNPFQDKAEELIYHNWTPTDRAKAREKGDDYTMNRVVFRVASALLASHQEGVKEGVGRVRDAVVEAYESDKKASCHTLMEAARKAYEHETETY